MTNKKTILTGLLLVFVLVGVVSVVEAKEDFHFGVRGLQFPDSPSLATEVGAEWSTTPFTLTWDDLEPTQSEYRFDELDVFIKGYQNLNIYPYVIISAYSEWATPDCYPNDDRTSNTCLPETEEDKQAWKDFVRNLAERYDNDGINDMPGLKGAVNHFQVSEEWPTAWTPGVGKVNEYVNLLKITSEAAKEANSNAKIATAGLTTGYRFLVYADGYITDPDGGLRKGIRYTPDEIKKDLIYFNYDNSIRYMIKNGGDYFDIFTIHAFEEKDTFLEGKIKWLKDRFVEYGYPNKGILLSAGHGPFRNTQEEINCMTNTCELIIPYPEGCPEVDHYDGDCSFGAWTYKEHAEYVVKLYSIAAGNGVIGSPWLLGSEKVKRDPTRPWNGPFIHDNLAEGDIGKKPGFYTYKLMTSKVKEFSSIETIDSGEGKGIYKYIVNNKPVIVAWNNNGATIDLSQYISTPNAKITHIVTELGKTEPETEIKPSNKIPISETPIFVEAEGIAPPPSPTCEQISLGVNIDKSHYEQGETLTGNISITNAGQKVSIDLSLGLYKKSQDKHGKDKWVLFWQRSAKLNIPEGTKTISLDKAFTFSPTIPFQDFVLGKWKLKFEGRYASQTGTKSLGAMLKSIITGKSTDSGTTKTTEPTQSTECQWQDEDEFNINKGKEQPPKAGCGNNVCEVGEDEISCPEDCGVKTEGLSFVGIDPLSKERCYDNPDLCLNRFKEIEINFYGNEQFGWSALQPTERGPYEWEIFDFQIRETEKVNGMSLIKMWSGSKWASSITPVRGGKSGRALPSSPIKPEYIDDFKNFVKAVVERYDGDGIDDMPGLKYSHLFYQFEGEPDSFFPECKPEEIDIWKGAHWCGTPEEYNELVKIFYQAAKEANPNVVVLSPSPMFSDIFALNYDRARFNSIVTDQKNYPNDYKRNIFIRTLFSESENWDVVSVQCNLNYKTFVPWTKWVREQVSNKDIWCVDSAAGYLYNSHQHSHKEYDKENIIEYALRTGSQDAAEELGFANYNNLLDWALSEQSKNVFKKITVSAVAGAKHIFFQWPFEAPDPNNGWISVGLLEDDLPDGKYPFGTPRPSFYAIKQFNEKIGNFDSVVDLNPLPEGIDPIDWTWKIKFTKDNKDIYVLWSDAENMTIDLSAYLSTSKVKITHIVTELDVNNNPIYPADEIKPSNKIPISETPIFVEEH